MYVNTSINHTTTYIHVVLQVLGAHAGLEVVVVQGHLLHLFVLYVLMYVTTRAVS